MNKSNLPKLLIVALLLVVAWQGFGTLMKMKQGAMTPDVNNPMGENGMSLPTQAMQQPSLEFSLLADSALRVGKTTKVTLKMKALEAKNIDSVEVYIPFDPQMVKVDPTIVSGAKMPKPVFSKVSTSRNVVVSNFFVTEPKGIMMAMGDSMDVITFSVTPLKTGQLGLDLSTSTLGSSSATLVVENGSAKAIPFKTNMLEVAVTN